MLELLMIVFGIILHVTEVQKKKVPFYNYLLPAGKITLSLFVYSHILKLLPFEWNFLVNTINALITVTLMMFLARIWVVKGRMIGTLEWLSLKYTGLIYYSLAKDRKMVKVILAR